MKKINLILTILLSFYVEIASGKGLQQGQYLPDELNDVDILLQDTDKEESFLGDGIKGAEDRIPAVKKDSRQFSLPVDTSSDKKEFSIPHILEEDRQGHIEENLGDRSYIEYNTGDLLKTLYKRGNHNFSILFYKDTFEYASKDESFRKTFIDSPKADFPFMVTLSGHQFVSRDFGDLGMGVNASVSLHRGSGFFLNGVMAPMKFLLWGIPVDLYALYEISLFRFIKFSFSGGPSIYTFIQNRSDKGGGDKNKNIYQYSLGYFTGGMLKFNITQMTKTLSFSMYRLYSVTQTYLTMSARYNTYERFKSTDVSVSGLSLGIGLSYEYF